MQVEKEFLNEVEQAKESISEQEVVEQIKVEQQTDIETEPSVKEIEPEEESTSKVTETKEPEDCKSQDKLTESTEIQKEESDDTQPGNRRIFQRRLQGYLYSTRILIFGIEKKLKTGIIIFFVAAALSLKFSNNSHCLAIFSYC